jgi:predicted ATP-grasp superfamily ATP-dependent carboligase
MDFVLRGSVPYPVEVNPRFTAATEVLELCARTDVMTTHAKCFSESLAHAQYKIPRRYNSPVGKAIYYAPHRIAFPASGSWDADLTGEFDPWRLPNFADIPEPGSAIKPGWPVITIFAAGSSTAECRHRLQSRAAELDHLFAEATS